MDKILEDLYYCQELQDETVKWDEKSKQEIEKLDIVHDKVMNALKQVYGEKEANEIDDEYYDILSSLTCFQGLEDFKKGFYLGLDLGKIIFKEDE